MMTTIRLAQLSTLTFALGLALTLAQPAHAEQFEFWSGAVEGMSESDILRLFPAAIEPEDPERLVTGDLSKFRYAGTEQLRDCTARFEGNDACARFYFDKGRLVAVDVGLSNLDRSQPTVTAAQAKQLREALTAQLNVAPTCEDYKGSDYRGPSSFCTWTAGSRLVKMHYSHGLLPNISSTDKTILSVTFRHNPKAK